MAPLVTVIIPTYNRAHLVDRAIQSVLGQTFRDFELIIVDDASTDRTSEAIQPFLRDARLRYLRLKSNQGGSAARNTGLAEANGQYIAFLDSDDEWLPEKLDIQVQAFRRAAPAVGLVYTGFRKTNRPDRSDALRSRGDVSRSILVQNFVGTTSTPLIKADLLAKTGGFDRSLPSCQDWDLWIRLAGLVEFEYVDQVLVLSHYQGDSISANRAATIEGHLGIEAKYRQEIASLNAGQRSGHYLYMGKVFWWKRDLARSLGRFFRSAAASPRTLPRVVSFLAGRSAHKVLRTLGIRKTGQGGPPPGVSSPRTPAGSRIRVLLLLEHMRVGGAERSVADLVEGLAARDVEVAVCLYRDMGPFADELIEAGHPVIYLAKDRFSRRLGGARKVLCFPLVGIESLLFIFRLARLIRKHRIRIVHAHMFSAGLWGLPAARLVPECRVILSLHTVFGAVGTAKRRRLNRFLLPRFDRLVAVTGEVAASLDQAYRVNPRRLSVIPNGLPEAVFTGGQRGLLPSGRTGPDVRPPLAITVGRLIPVKRHDLFIRAVALCAEDIPNLTAWIVGEGPERKKLERLIQEYELEGRVSLLGQRNDVPALFTKADLALNTSEREGLPVSLLEAMAAGLPVVATDVSGNRELVRDGETGLLVPAGDSRALARAMLRLLRDPDLAERLGRTGYHQVLETYSMKRVGKMWADLYQEALIERSAEH
ncbi:MAG: glycosyltransferase [Proteobacteria bacterium]|nr:glycosyltransferase [Pseudomonadota bacterium]